MECDGEVNGFERVNGPCLEAVEVRLVELRHSSHSALPVSSLAFVVHLGVGHPYSTEAVALAPLA